MSGGFICFKKVFKIADNEELLSKFNKQVKLPLTCELNGAKGVGSRFFHIH